MRLGQITIPVIPSVICIIVAIVLLYKPFFGAKKDFLDCLDSFLTSGTYFSWLKDPKKNTDAESMKMTIFLILAFVSSLIGALILEPAFKWLGL